MRPIHPGAAVFVSGSLVARYTSAVHTSPKLRLLLVALVPSCAPAAARAGRGHWSTVPVGGLFGVESAYITGLAVRFWKSLGEDEFHRVISRLFEPVMDHGLAADLCAGWALAIERSKRREGSGR
jgi:hypothetical protein